MKSRHLSDGSEAGQGPQAAAVGDDHGLRQQTGRVILGRVRLAVHCNEERVSDLSHSMLKCPHRVAVSLTVTRQRCHGCHKGTGSHVALKLL